MILHPCCYFNVQGLLFFFAHVVNFPTTARILLLTETLYTSLCSGLPLTLNPAFGCGQAEVDFQAGIHELHNLTCCRVNFAAILGMSSHGNAIQAQAGVDTLSLAGVNVLQKLMGPPWPTMSPQGLSFKLNS